MDGVQPIVHQAATPAVARTGGKPERERRRAFERELDGQEPGDERQPDAAPAPPPVRRRPPPAVAGEGRVDLIV